MEEKGSPARSDRPKNLPLCVSCRMAAPHLDKPDQRL